jgi:hypothetical protein
MTKVKVTVETDEKTREKWHHHVDQLDEVASLSELVRISVERYISESEEESAKIDLRKIENKLEDIQQDTDDISTDTQTIKKTQITETDIQGVVRKELQTVLEEVVNDE